MTTFDLALKYLKNFDFSKIDIYDEDNIQKYFFDEIEKRHRAYLRDAENIVSNEHYRSCVFETAIRHLIEIADNRPSFFYVACEIVESEIEVLNGRYDKFMKTNYPKVMVDKFIKYCDELKPQPSFLSSESDMRIEHFMVAFHYIADNES